MCASGLEKSHWRLHCIIPRNWQERSLIYLAQFVMDQQRTHQGRFRLQDFTGGLAVDCLRLGDVPFCAVS